MRLSVLPLLIAGAGLGERLYCLANVEVAPAHPFVVSASPLSVMIASTDLSAMRLGHPAAGAAHAQMMNAAAAQPTSGRRMRHLCKGMQDGVTRFFGVFSFGSTTKVVTPVPAHDTIALTRPNLRLPPPAPYGLRPGEPVFRPHGLQIVDDDRGGVVVKMKAEQMLTESGLPERPMFVVHYPLNHSGSFLQRVHRALMSLGAWEGRAVAFVLGAPLSPASRFPPSLISSLPLFAPFPSQQHVVTPRTPRRLKIPTS